MKEANQFGYLHLASQMMKCVCVHVCGVLLLDSVNISNICISGQRLDLRTGYRPTKLHVVQTICGVSEPIGSSAYL